MVKLRALLLLLIGATALAAPIFTLPTSGTGGGTPGGLTTNVQYNSSGTFGGNSSFTYDGTGDITLTGTMTASSAAITTLMLNGSLTTGNTSPTTGSFVAGSSLPSLTAVNVIAIGQSTASAETSGANNVLIGNGAGIKISSGSFNTAIGNFVAAGMTTASNETAVGYQAAQLDTNGQNTAVGYQACQDGTSASHSICIGYQAGQQNVTGTDNISIGYQAFNSNVTNGSFNIALGTQALKVNSFGGGNIAIGYQTLLNNAGGSYNTAVGFNSLGGVQGNAGQQNTALGYGAGTTGTPVTTGSLNTFVGFQAQTSLATIINSTCLGANCTVATSNTIELGGTTTTVLLPNTLTVAGGSTLTGATLISGALNASSTVSAPNLVQSSSAATGTVCWTTGTGNFTVDTTTTCLLSTRKIKQLIDPIDVGLSEIMKLTPVSYELKPEHNPAHLGRHVGFISEEVAGIDDRLVSRDARGDPMGVRYMQLTAVLTKAIQEQQHEIEILETKVRKLQRKK